jgi:hypothetical protein
MWRRKKFVILGLLAAVLIAGASIGGIALAQGNGTEDDSQPTLVTSTLWDKVATILQDDGVNVTSEQLQNAFKEAQGQIQTEALQNRLNKLVAEDKITQEEADEYLKWLESRPDIANKLGTGGHFRFFGIGGMRGWGGLCIPTK